MVTAYLVAAVVALAAAWGTADYPRLPYWRHWDRGAVIVALGLIYSVYALTGVLVTGLALHWGWEPLDSGSGRAWVNGMVYGAAAVALLRLEITSFGLSSVSPARLLLKTFLDRFGKSLDAGADRAVPRWVGDLTPEQLGLVSWQLFERHVAPELAEHRPDVAPGHVDWLVATHARALEAVGSADTNDPAEALRRAEIGVARESLRFYIATTIVDNHDSTIRFSA